MKTLTWLMAATAIVLIGCQSAPKTTPVAAAPTTATPATAGTTGTPAAAPTVVDASSVTAGDTGFSPLAQAPTIFFLLPFTSPTPTKWCNGPSTSSVREERWSIPSRAKLPGCPPT